MTTRPRTLLAMTDEAAGRLFDGPAAARLAALAELSGPWHGTFDTAALAATEVVVTWWGSPPVDVGVLAAAPRLRAVFHTGGTVRRVVTDACWERDLVVVSAAAANAIPVAEYTFAAVIHAGKRIPQLQHHYRTDRGATWHPRELMAVASNHRRVVGLVGLSRIGRRVADLLRHLEVRVLAADPFATAADAERLGVHLVELDDLLSRSDIVSLHAPLLPDTRHLIDARRLALLPDGAVLVNTARGALVDTDALTKELASGRLAAILDVTDPEPLPADSPLYDLPNVVLTPHVAGSSGSEMYRMGDLVVDELTRWLDGDVLRHQVRREDLDRVA